MASVLCRLAQSTKDVCCADKHGAFVQPALYEAFGLTVVEAMSCGLPTFATNQGGPAEVPPNKAHTPTQVIRCPADLCAYQHLSMQP